MMDLKAIFRAGCVLRWHTNPDLATTGDRIDGHSARVARILIALHPSPSVTLLCHALIHDDGESAVGDVPAPAKDSTPGLAEWLEVAEEAERRRLWSGAAGPDGGARLTDSDRLWLRFADRLDAFQWAAHHGPSVMNGDGWPEARGWLLATAYTLDCYNSVARLVDGSGRGDVA